VNAILDTDNEADFWDTLPDYVKEDVEEAFQQSEQGEVKTHEE